MTVCDLTKKNCVPCEGGVPALTADEVKTFLAQVTDWQVNADYTEINRVVRFKDYYQTMAFVNAIAWLAHQDNHHPDLEVHYDHVTIRYSTHAINGLSENDFICAAKVDGLLAS